VGSEGLAGQQGRVRRIRCAPCAHFAFIDWCWSCVPRRHRQVADHLSRGGVCSGQRGNGSCARGANPLVVRSRLRVRLECVSTSVRACEYVAPFNVRVAAFPTHVHLYVRPFVRVCVRARVFMGAPTPHCLSMRAANHNHCTVCSSFARQEHTHIIIICA
jgi:hypothetical protein